LKKNGDKGDFLCYYFVTVEAKAGKLFLADFCAGVTNFFFWKRILFRAIPIFTLDSSPNGGKFETQESKRVAATRPMTLQDRVLQIDHIQARRFSKLSGDAVEIAAEGIIRHLRACARMDVNPDASAVREIIDDALNGRRVFAETSNDLLAA